VPEDTVVGESVVDDSQVDDYYPEELPAEYQ
jgi:hypothetical protein